MHRQLLIWAGISGALAVALGAFGAHGLQRITDDAKLIQGYRTGVEYQLYHTLALLLVALLCRVSFSSGYRLVARLFMSGILLFSGSLYLFAFLQLQSVSIPGWLRLLTPLGGVFLIMGWLALVWTAARENGQKD